MAGTSPAMTIESGSPEKRDTDLPSTRGIVDDRRMADGGFVKTKPVVRPGISCETRPGGRICFPRARISLKSGFPQAFERIRRADDFAWLCDCVDPGVAGGACRALFH